MRWLLALALLGCSTPEAGRGAAPSFAEARLVSLGSVEGPAGADAPTRTRVAFEAPDGAREPVALAAIAFVPRWGEGAALIDPARRLYEVTPGGGRRMLAEDAAGPLAVGARRLAYVTERGGLGALHVHDGAQPRALAEGFASIGTLRVEADEVLFVGARPGGVVGVWRAAAGEAPRCLSNCALRADAPLDADFAPPPVTAEAFDPSADSVAWTTPDGRRYVRPRGEGVP